MVEFFQLLGEVGGYRDLVDGGGGVWAGTFHNDAGIVAVDDELVLRQGLDFLRAGRSWIGRAAGRRSPARPYLWNLGRQ